MLLCFCVLSRLNTLERASMYEQTWSDNWLDELDGAGDEALRESLENGQTEGRKKGSTGSDVVVSTSRVVFRTELEFPFHTSFYRALLHGYWVHQK